MFHVYVEPNKREKILWVQFRIGKIKFTKKIYEVNLTHVIRWLFTQMN